MTLGELIKFLEARKPETPVAYGFGEGMSYRGNYEDAGFQPQRDTTIGAMLGHAKALLGTTQQGYKGGDYVMNQYVDCYIAPYGDCGDEIGHLLLKYMLGETP